MPTSASDSVGPGKVGEFGFLRDTWVVVLVLDQLRFETLGGKEMGPRPLSSGLLWSSLAGPMESIN